MSTPRILVYLLRRDLRLIDNPILHEIGKSCQQSHQPYTHLLPLYIFPAQQLEVSGFLSAGYERSPFPEARSKSAGFWRCGPHRAKFLAESVWDMKRSLEGVGNGLEIRVGMVGQVMKEVLEAYKNDDTQGEIVGVWMTSEEGVEEKQEERDVRRVVEGDGKTFKLWTDEKYYIDEYVSFRNIFYIILLTSEAATFPFVIPVTFQMFSRLTENKLNLCEMPLGVLYQLLADCPLFHRLYLLSQHLLLSLVLLTV